MLPNPAPQQYPEPPAPVRAVRVGDETVIPLDATTGYALVASQTEPDVWHVVEQGHCDCKAFRYRETCRHLALVAAAFPPPPPFDWAAAEAVFARIAAGGTPVVHCARCGAIARRPVEPDLPPLCGKCAKAAITLADD